MKSSLLFTLLGLLASASLTAQTGSVTASTLDITLTNPPLGPSATTTTTFVTGSAVGTPANGTVLSIRPNDELTLSNGAALLNGTGCTVTGGNLELVFGPNSAAPVIVSFPLVPDNDCSSPNRPANVPACGPGDGLFRLSPLLPSTLPLNPLGANAPDGSQISVRITITPLGAGCATLTPEVIDIQLRVESLAPTPVTLTSFKAERISGRDVVAWSAAQEVDLAGYSLERSLDGERFFETAYVPALGTSHGARDYGESLALATEALDAVVYYRLRSIDLDGSYAYSKVISVGGSRHADQALAADFVAPNVVPGGRGFTIVRTLAPGTTIDVYDMSGRRLLRVPATLGNSIGEGLPAGRYVLSAVGAAGVSTQQVAVQ